MNGVMVPPPMPRYAIGEWSRSHSNQLECLIAMAVGLEWDATIMANPRVRFICS
jgi:hypothetical protein